MKIVAILNGKAGNGCAPTLIPALRVQLHSTLADICLPATAEAATEAARSAVRNGADVIIAGGGDGTVNAIINGMDRGNTALALLPTGTANDLAAEHGVGGNLHRICAAILGRRTGRIDLIDVNGWRYATDGGLGLCASIAVTANALRAGSSPSRHGWMFGSAIYPLATFLSLAGDARQCRAMHLEGDGWNGEVRSPLLMINNQRSLGGHFPVSPRARNNDGLFDVCLVTNRDGRYGLLRLVSEVLRERHLDRPDIHNWRGAALRVETETPLPWLGDGELRSAATRFDVRILPAALRLVLPAPTHSLRVN